MDFSNTDSEPARSVRPVACRTFGARGELDHRRVSGRLAHILRHSPDVLAVVTSVVVQGDRLRPVEVGAGVCTSDTGWTSFIGNPPLLKAKHSSDRGNHQVVSVCQEIDKLCNGCPTFRSARAGGLPLKSSQLAAPPAAFFKGVGFLAQSRIVAGHPCLTKPHQQTNSE